MKRYFLPLLIFLAASFALDAAELSPQSLSGKWLFTHMKLDGATERKVNRLMEFKSDGVVINYDAAGKESSRASYKISEGVIVYSDQRGDQKWKVKAFGKENLHVDNSGAEMFFKRQ